MKYVQDMSSLLSSKMTDNEYAASSHLKATLHQVFFIHLQLMSLHKLAYDFNYVTFFVIRRLWNLLGVFHYCF